MAGESFLLTFNDGFFWLDVVNPTKKELDSLAKQYNLHHSSVKDCLEPNHLPKFERINNHNFFIIRTFDQNTSPDECDTVQELTRKVAFFSTDKFLITIHRKDQPFIKVLREKWRLAVAAGEFPANSSVLSDILRESFLTFEKPIDDGLDELGTFEMGIFSAQGAKPFLLQDGYFLKRRAFVFKRILRYSQDVITKLAATGDRGEAPFHQDLRETLDGLYFYADELLENVNSLLNLHISLSSQRTNEASHRTNEVVRVLTIFSIFFLPLNFLSGIYGMNFENMPELRTENGYFAVLGLMFFIATAFFFWLRHKGWLHRQDL
jgi:magnesium transporter